MTEMTFDAARLGIVQNKEVFDVTCTRSEIASNILQICFGISPQGDSEEYETALQYVEKLSTMGMLTVNGAWYTFDWSAL